MGFHTPAGITWPKKGAATYDVMIVMTMTRHMKTGEVILRRAPSQKKGLIPSSRRRNARRPALPRSRQSCRILPTREVRASFGRARQERLTRHVARASHVHETPMTAPVDD